MWFPEVMPSTPRARNSSRIFPVMPLPAAAFSQLIITKSNPCHSSRRAGRAFARAVLPGLPSMSPTKRMRMDASLVFYLSDYFANSVARVSRDTLTLIWPGYFISASIFRAMS